MKIIVAIKQVQERDAQIRIAAAAKWIEESDLQFALNESDAYTLEETLQLKEKSAAADGEVIVVSAGPGDPYCVRRPGRARWGGCGAIARRSHQAGES
jgi:electron transfer flavoprotein alpha/beta subunit